MEKDEEIEIIELKKEMDNVGERSFDKIKKIRYITLRRKQKLERRNQQIAVPQNNHKQYIEILYILLGLIPFIIIGFIIWGIMNGGLDSGNDCIIGQDSADCLDGAGAGHPLWNN